MTKITLTVQNQDQTQRLAAKLAQVCAPGDVIALFGDLGVGKSVFARAFIQSLCGEDEDVPSPTFTLVQSYDSLTGEEIFHFDMYRLENPDEVLELGIDDAFHDGVSLIEWPQKIGSYLPWDCLKVSIEQTGATSRNINLEIPSAWQSKIKEANLESA